MSRHISAELLGGCTKLEPTKRRGCPCLRLVLSLWLCMCGCLFRYLWLWWNLRVELLGRYMKVE